MLPPGVTFSLLSWFVRWDTLSIAIIFLHLHKRVHEKLFDVLFLSLFHLQLKEALWSCVVGVYIKIAFLYSCRLWLVPSDNATAAYNLRRRLSLEMNNPPLIMYGKGAVGEWEKSYTTSFSVMAKALPDNVHLLSLKARNDSSDGKIDTYVGYWPCRSLMSLFFLHYKTILNHIFQNTLNQGVWLEGPCLQSIIKCCDILFGLAVLDKEKADTDTVSHWLCWSHAVSVDLYAQIPGALAACVWEEWAHSVGCSGIIWYRWLLR